MLPLICMYLLLTYLPMQPHYNHILYSFPPPPPRPFQPLALTSLHSGHVQIAQVPGRHEPDDDGEVNFPFLFKLLRRLGYDGWVACEYIPRGKRVLPLLLWSKSCNHIHAGKTEEGLIWASPYLKCTPAVVQ